MLTRRSVIIGGSFLAFASAAHVVGSFAREGVVSEALVVPRMILAETGMPGVSACLSLARTRFDHVIAFPDNVAHLWMGPLENGRMIARNAVAGISSRATLFCLEDLLRDQGMTLIGAVRLDNPDVSSNLGNGWQERAARSLQRQPDRFSAAVDLLVTGAPFAPVSDLPAERYARAPADAVLAWILAPRPGFRRFVASRRA